jgi:hypothetical protein
VVEHLFSKHKTLNSNPNTTRRKIKENVNSVCDYIKYESSEDKVKDKD